MLEPMSPAPPVTIAFMARDSSTPPASAARRARGAATGAGPAAYALVKEADMSAIFTSLTVFLNVEFLIRPLSMRS